ncbi:MAG: hypothetical protein FGF52_05200 [Candidatus Brockarchaeota archaeon]|nr:hypothetical protein [Candidatus Brockarchaeota archaeon]
MEPLKRELLELLDKDREFRYAVAGYLGISEVLKRLDDMAGEQVRLRKDFNTLRKDFISLREDFKSLREEQVKLREDFKSLREEQVRLREDFNALRKDFISLREEQVKLREDFNEMLKEIRDISVRLERVERTLEKLTLDIEEEARSIVSYRIKQELGLEVKLGSLSLPDLELNIYGTSDGFCIVGEASVRAGVGLVDELLEKIERLKSRHPDRVRGKLITVIYTSLPMPELVEKAKEKGVWILKATEDFFKPPLHSLPP